MIPGPTPFFLHPRAMSLSVRDTPIWPPHASAGSRVTSSSSHVTSYFAVISRLMYHPCSVKHGTGKLSINIIYSKRHRACGKFFIFLVLIYDVGLVTGPRVTAMVFMFCVNVFLQLLVFPVFSVSPGGGDSWDTRANLVVCNTAESRMLIGYSTTAMIFQTWCEFIQSETN